MAGSLTQERMDILETWVNGGAKTFNMLYKITRDGCSATTFHEKCDNKGPTVTVLYGGDDTVYGGYTAVSWSGDLDHRDDTAFLYRLQYRGDVRKRSKFPVKPGNTTYAVCCRSGNGPIFGYGNDLHTFSGTIQNTGVKFKLDGKVNLGKSYDTLGMTSDDLNGGSMVVTEMEVYGVTDGVRPKPILETPWCRSPPWDESLLESLMETVLTHKPKSDNSMDVKESRILFLGPVGSGKTSFFNTIQSIFMERITQKGCCGSVQHSVTTTYRQYQVQCKSGEPLKFRLCDTRGLEETYGLDPLELNYLLDGNVPDWYQFNPDAPISIESLEFIKNPGPGDKIHCVVFVVDASTLEVLPEKTIERIKQAQATMYRKSIPQIVLLTKVDKLCKEIEEDVSKTYRSKVVKDMVDDVAHIFGVPPSNVCPVKNYHTGLDLERDINILALVALRKMLNFADDYLGNCLDRIHADNKKYESLMKRCTCNCDQDTE